MVTQFKEYTIPLYLNKISAGFPSPADDFIEQSIDLNEIMISHASATKLITMPDDALQKLGIFAGDYLLLDKALKPKQGSIVACYHEGTSFIGQLEKRRDSAKLSPYSLLLNSDSVVEGVVKWVVRRL